MDLTPDGVFARYQEIRGRLPLMPAVRETHRVAGLAAIADEFDVFLFDAFGVLNVGEAVIPGAPAVIAGLRARGKDVRVVTNAATQDKAALLRKFSGMGFDFSAAEIISSRAILTGSLHAFAKAGEWAAILPEGGSREGLPPGTHTRDRDPEAFWNAEGFLFLSSKEWDEEHQERLIARLKRRPCAVLIGNPDLVAPREYGLSREPGYFAHDILDRTECPVQFFGKPFANVFDAAAEVLARRGKLDRGRIVMVGDTLHTDILGGAAAGMKTVLVTDHGLFKGSDAEAFVEASGIRPDFIIPSI